VNRIHIFIKTFHVYSQIYAMDSSTLHNPVVTLPPHTASDFHVAIVGGGIGGLTTALCLAHHCPGISISIYEQAREYKEIGAGIGISVNAARILHQIGVGAAVNAISGERDGVHRSNRRFDNGADIVTIEAMDDSHDVAIRQLSVHRAEFLDVLLQAVKEKNIAKLYADRRAVQVEVHIHILTVSGYGMVLLTLHLPGSKSWPNKNHFPRLHHCHSQPRRRCRWHPLCHSLSISA
jgi:hypothetical protein